MEKKYKLPKEFAQKWIAALRSGEYEQGRLWLIQGLSDEYTYCCMGVAEIVGGNIPEKLMGRGISRALGINSKVPEELQVSLYDHNENTRVTTISIVGDLSHLNDDLGYDFNQIADWIEANVELYETAA